ncbi:MAG TPA: LPS assembly protein LptD [Geminicoccus sp.]|jgi:LPS-assembly protein|uniref:LPS-assembly protein LptD n=1 Tax=Geminicoccus sp. TaxID=2024832 RepID=UPI002E35DD04|nr:LPS assembly protein LptD [Geminicoccus sp.]HEX2527484.1 LPS assembly protein LptD [Geminicoccus sp.]
MIVGLLRRILPLAIVLCPYTAQLSAQEQEPQVLLTADRLDYQQAGNLIVAEGDVELTRDGRTLLARKVTWDRSTDIVTAEGDVVLIGEEGETLFGDKVELSDSLRAGFIQEVGLLLADDSRLAARRAVRKGGNITELDRAVYSPCPLCDDPDSSPLWQIKSRKVTHDQTTKDVTYEDATFDMFGVPVMYLPRFSHPDPSVARRSGFLRPKFGSRTALGAFIQVPYYYVISPSEDVTLAPLVTSEQGVALFGEYRRMDRFGPTELTGSATYADRYAGSNGNRTEKDFRGHFKGNGRYEFENGYGGGFDAYLASDDTYLRRYDIDDENLLVNRPWVDRAWDTNYGVLDAFYFQGLRQSDDPGLTPFVLPRGAVRWSTPTGGTYGGFYNVEASMLALTRSDGLDTRRLSTTGGWSKPIVGRFGDVMRVSLSMRTDGYQTDGNPETFGDNGGSNAAGRLYPLASAEWSLPLVKMTEGGWQHLIEPVIVGHLSPYGGNPDDIPNEDSQSLDFDDTNVFQANRFPGLDRVEGGPRGAYGVRFGSFSPDMFGVAGMIGQSWRYKDDDTFQPGSGLDDNFSDYVGRVEMHPAQWLNLSYRFRIDDELREITKNDLLASFGWRRLGFGLGYLSLADDPDLEDVQERKELTASVRAGVTEDIFISAGVRQDLVADEPVTYALGLVYNHPCLVLVAGLERDYTEDRDAGPATTLLFRVTLKNLGELGGRTSLSGIGASS